MSRRGLPHGDAAEPDGASRGIADFNRHLLTLDREGGLNLLGFRAVFGIEHSADYPLMDPQSPCEFRVADALIAHGQVERELRGQPEWHRNQALTTLRG